MKRKTHYTLVQSLVATTSDATREFILCYGSDAHREAFSRRDQLFGEVVARLRKQTDLLGKLRNQIADLKRKLQEASA